MMKSGKHLSDLFLWDKAYALAETREYNNEEIIDFKSTFNSLRSDIKSAQIPILLGRPTSGELVCEDLADYGHLVIGSHTGAGKTSFIESFITTLTLAKDPTTINLHVIDTKEICLSHFKGIPHLASEPANDSNSCIKMLESLAGLLESRIKSKEKEEVNNYSCEVLIIEELADLLLYKEAPRIEGLLIELLKEGHKYGIHLLIATYVPSIKVLRKSLMDLIPTRISFRIGHKDNYETILGIKSEYDLKKAGEFVQYRQGKLKQFKAPYVEYEYIIEMVKQIDVNN